MDKNHCCLLRRAHSGTGSNSSPLPLPARLTRPLDTGLRGSCPLRRAHGQRAPVAGVNALAVCQRLMHFFRQHLLYETFDVLEPLWRSLDSVLASPDADLDLVRFSCCHLLSRAVLRCEQEVVWPASLTPTWARCVPFAS